MLPHEGQNVVARPEAFAMREELCQPGAGAIRQLPQEGIGAPIHVAEQRQIVGIRGRRDSIRGYVAEGVIAQNANPREMQPLEGAKGDQGVLRIGMSGLGVHPLEERGQFVVGFRAYRHHHEECRLRRHDEAEKSKLKLINRFLAQ